MTQLSNVAYNFGALTKQAFGGVRLSAQDNNTYARKIFGLGLLNAGANAPVTWTIKQTGGTAGHWQINGSVITSGGISVSEGAAALTPQPSAAGAGILSGVYTFSVTYVDAGSVTSNTATLTITAVADAINIGNADLFKATNLLGSIAAWDAAGGTHMYFSVGLDRTNIRNTTTGLAFTAGNPCVLAWSDPARPGGITSIEFPTASNLTIESIVLVGNIPIMAVYEGGFYFNKGCDTITLNSCGAINNRAQLTSASVAIVCYGINNLTVNDFEAQWFSGFIKEADGSANVVATAVGYTNNNCSFNRCKVRYVCNNYVFLGSGRNWSFIDCKFVAPTRINSTHIDYFQIGNGATPTGLTITRLGCYQADGDSSSQGFFAGTGTGSALGGAVKGYIDDGNGTGTPGNILTITQIGTKSPWVPFAKVVGDTAGVISADTQIGYLIASPNGYFGAALIPNPGATYKLLGSAQAVGSPGSPVNLYSAPIAVTLDGFIFAGIDSNVLSFSGLDASSLKHFTCVKQASPAPNVTTLTGHISGTTLTLDTDASGSSLGILAGASIFLASAPTTSLGTITSLLTGTANKAGATYRVSSSQTAASQAILISFDIAQSLGPWIRLDSGSTGALYPTASTFDKGYMGDNLIETAGHPSNVTLTSAVHYGLTSVSQTLQATLFALGDPTSVAVDGSHTASIWAAKTVDQVAGEYASFLKPAAAATFTGSITSGTNQLTVVSGSVPAAGTLINGPGLAHNITVLSVSGSVLTLSGNASSTSASQTFGTLLKKADGSDIGALTPAGLWADGSGVDPGVPPTPVAPADPTAIALSVSKTHLLVGEKITVTARLDVAATAITTITPAATGASGMLFSPNPIVLAIGATEGSADFSASTTGIVSISVTNDRSLTNPLPRLVTVANVKSGQLRRYGIR